MQGCNYSLLAKPTEELQQRDTELPDITTLCTDAQMHIALDLYYMFKTASLLADSIVT